jgi:hypothetical protein
MKKLWIEDTELHPSVVWSENAPNQDFIDKTNDVVSWDMYGNQALDYDRYRYEMKSPFYALAGNQLQNWGSLSSEIKEIGARYFFVPYALRLTIVTEEQDYANWDNLIIKTQGTPVENYVGRAETFDKMRRKVANLVRREEMSMTDSQQMLKDVGQMVDWYIRANSPEFKQWLTNEVGSAFESDGFAQKNYYSLALKNDLYDIYNGNY